MTVGQRIKEFMECKELSRKAIGKALLIDDSQISKWTEGKLAVPDKHFVSILQNYPDLNANWLLRGTGPMLLTSSEENPISKIEDPASPYVSPCSNPACKKQLNDLIQKHEIEKERLWLHIGELTRKVGQPSENTIQGGVEETRRTG